MSAKQKAVVCRHPSKVVQLLAGTGWQWCSRCGSIYHPGPGATWGKPSNPAPKKVYVVCRHIVQTHLNVAVFYEVCSTEDRAQAMVDDLTKKEGPTFVIVPAVVDP